MATRRNEQLEKLNDLLESLTPPLDEAAKLISGIELNSHENIGHIAEVLARILIIQQQIYAERPDLTPEYLKPGWSTSSPPDEY